MVELLEKVLLEAKQEDLSSAATIRIKGDAKSEKREIPIRNYMELSSSEMQVYSCDANCDNCHCATYKF